MLISQCVRIVALMKPHSHHAFSSNGTVRTHREGMSRLGLFSLLGRIEMTRPTVMWPKELVKLEYRSGVKSGERFTSDRVKEDRVRRNAQDVARKAHPVVQPCERCGNKNGLRHHDDYSKPMQIRWLCRSCHDQHHLSQVNSNYRKKPNVKARSTARGRSQRFATRKINERRER